MAAASSSISNSKTPLSSTFSEDKWLDQTNKILENGLPLDLNIPISVCQVPNSISVVNPKAYAPQMISLGPYHYLQPELYQMERYKIETVKSYWNPNQIRLVVDKLRTIVLMARACYHKYLDMSDETLALVIAIDGLFLVYLLSKHLNGFSDNANVFSDVMMLENQIPLILLKEIVKTIGLPDSDDAKVLFSMMWGFCESQSPFGLQSKQQDFEEGKVLHLLDLLHKMITMHDQNDEQGLPVHDDASQEIELSQQASVTLNINPNDDQLIGNVKEILSTDVLSSIKPIRFISSLPWAMISNLLSQSSNLKEVATKNPLVEEIDIPSVSKLSKMAGITFKPSKNGNLNALFDRVTATLYLPTITLNGNSEVILRNLLAYEMASSSNENHILGQYIDVMSGIIDTKEDALLLRSVGVIKGDLNDSQVADLFNGMNKSSNREIYNEIADKVNVYYGQKLKVKAYGFVKKYVYKSWRFLTVVSMLVLLLLLTLQSFCSVYYCKGFFK